MSIILDERTKLVNLLTDMLGQSVSIVTTDAQQARPLPGKVAVLIEPPELSYEGWNFTNINWTIDLIAGTTATQTASLKLLLPVLEQLHDRRLNMQTAKPVTYSLPGAGNLAAYEIVLNPLEL